MAPNWLLGLFWDFAWSGCWIPRQPQVAPCLGSHGEEPEQVRESDTSSTQTPRDPLLETAILMAPNWLLETAILMAPNWLLETAILMAPNTGA